MSFKVFKHDSLIIIEVPLTQKEIDKCLEMGKKRTELDEEELGWTYRHHGMKSEKAHAIGFMGELAFEKILDSEGIEYIRNNPFVEKYEDIEQDFRIGNIEIGVKSANNDSLEGATRYGTFLYPAKQEMGESKRILSYPDYLVQTVVSISEKKCWVCGFVDEETIRKSPTRIIVRRPAHRIPIDEYKPIETLLKELD